MSQFTQKNQDNQNVGTWRCAECETINFGYQCRICGQPKPKMETGNMKICSCGYHNSSDAKFCSECGKKLKQGPINWKKIYLFASITAILILSLLAILSFGEKTIFHAHTWNAATCTTPKTCMDCNTTSGSALGHSWKDATCDTPKTCKICGITSGSSLGHKWKDSTFNAPKTCTVCGLTTGTKKPKPTISSSSVTVAEGKTAKVTVSAAGTGLTYQWFYKDRGDSTFTATKSFKGNSYYISMNSARDGRQVYCKITDKYGNSATSATATLKMEEKKTVKITSQPQSVKVAEGETAKVTVKATGEGLTYKWYYKNAGDNKYTYTSSFTGNSYYITMNASRNGRRVLCKVTDKYGNTVQSSSALLSMKTTTAASTSDKNYISKLTGSSAKVTLHDGYSTMNIHALVLSKKVEKCTKLTVHMNVDMKAGTSCKDWQLWGRKNGSFQKIGKINLPGGNGNTTQTISFSTPVTFDAIAITPTIPGGYSWSLGFTITDVYTKK